MGLDERHAGRYRLCTRGSLRRLEIGFARRLCCGNRGGVGASDALAEVRSYGYYGSGQRPNSRTSSTRLHAVIYGIKVVTKYLLGIDRAERNFAVYPDDTFIVSYPRSGNTWARFLIANLVRPNETVTFANIEKLIPDTSSQPNRALKRTP